MKTLLTLGFAIAALTGALAGSPAHAQVAVMNKVPTVAELQAALKRSPAATADEASRGLDARGIEWNAGAAPSAQVAKTAPGGAAPAASGGAAVALPIQFDLNSARLSGASSGYVDVIAQLMAQDPSLRLTVEGHTDSTGDPTRNLMLSWDRAMTVFRTLVERHGVDPQRLQPVGRGSLEPLEGMAPNAPMNRRVQFRVAG